MDELARIKCKIDLLWTLLIQFTYIWSQLLFVLPVWSFPVIRLDKEQCCLLTTARRERLILILLIWTDANFKISYQLFYYFNLIYFVLLCFIYFLGLFGFWHYHYHSCSLCAMYFCICFNSNDGRNYTIINFYIDIVGLLLVEERQDRGRYHLRCHSVANFFKKQRGSDPRNLRALSWISSLNTVDLFC